jgi:hypothetical protein
MLLYLLIALNPFYGVHGGVSGVAHLPKIERVVVIYKQPQIATPSNLDPLLQRYFGNNWKTAKSIAYCESHLNPLAINEKSQSIGLFQIRIAGNLAKSRPSKAELLNAEQNTAFAAKMSNGGKSWKAWSCAKIIGI